MQIEVTLQATINTGTRKIQLLVDETILTVSDEIYRNARFSDLSEMFAKEVKNVYINEQKMGSILK